MRPKLVITLDSREPPVEQDYCIEECQIQGYIQN